MNIFVALYTIREQDNPKSLYGVGLVATDKNGGVSFELNVTKMVGDNIENILLREILNEDIKSRISEKYEQIKIIKERITQQFKDFFYLIKDYSFISKTSEHFADCYNEKVKHDVAIGNKLYSEIYMLLNYELICKKIAKAERCVTRNDLHHYIADCIVEKAENVIPKYIFAFREQKGKYELALEGNSGEVRGRDFVLIYNSEDFKLYTKKYKGEELYIIPIRQRITRRYTYSILDYGYSYHHYTSEEPRFSKDEKSGFLLVARKTEKNLEYIEKIMQKYITKIKITKRKKYSYETAYEDSNVIIYIVSEE